MTCCGRTQTHRPANTTVPTHTTTLSVREPTLLGPTHLQSPGQSAVPYTYTGASRLVAEGPVTRRRYHFADPGAVLDVDVRDAPSFAAIPHLRRGLPG
ncbi:MAG: hypothetical protein RL375_4195 [Pseudomonadota bacterium]|jgi:hypothetical protein